MTRRKPKKRLYNVTPKRRRELAHYLRDARGRLTWKIDPEKYRSLAFKLAYIYAKKFLKGKRYTRIGSRSNDILTTIQTEAYIGLLDAIQKFEYRRNIKFITFAWKMISTQLIRWGYAYLRPKRHLGEDRIVMSEAHVTNVASGSNRGGSSYQSCTVVGIDDIRDKNDHRSYEILENKDLVHTIMRRLREERPTHYKVVRLSYLYDISSREIADHMGYTVMWVKVLIKEALDYMKANYRALYE